jgi:ABC-type xylose transport system permease subunit
VLVITTALVVLYALGTTRTVIGPRIYAVGGNAEARSSPAFRHQD